MLRLCITHGLGTVIQTPFLPGPVNTRKGLILWSPKQNQRDLLFLSSSSLPEFSLPSTGHLCSPSFLCGNLKGIFHIPLSHETCFQDIQDFHKFMLTAITYSHFSADTEFSSWVSRPTSSLTPSRSFSFQCHDACRSVYVNFMPHPSRDPSASTSPPWL